METETLKYILRHIDSLKILFQKELERQEQQDSKQAKDQNPARTMYPR